MAKNSSSPEFDQHDPKVFRETLGSFGTTTNPFSRNQLEELQTMVRRGVKSVEIHLANTGKGKFDTQDVPDKYGFEQRRTIMQLAKLNEQTLSVHGTFDINSFAGLAEGGFNEASRANNIKEIDETLKFASETAKGGAVVFHLHETNLRTPPGELNLPDWYLKKLKKERPDEYDRIVKEHLSKDNFERTFQDNPDLPSELKVKYDNLKKQDAKEYRDFQKRYKDELKDLNNPAEEWKLFYNKDYLEKVKNTEQSLVVVGNSLDRVNRNSKLINVINDKIQIKEGCEDFTKKEKEFLKEKGISTNFDKMHFEDFQELRALLLNGREERVEDRRTLASLKQKLMWNYDDMLASKNNMRFQADKDFYELEKQERIRMLQLKKKDLKVKKAQHKDVYEKVRKLERENRERLDKFDKINNKDNLTPEEKALKQVISEEIAEKNTEIEQLRYRHIGQMDFYELARYNETMAQINEEISELEKKTENTKVLTDEIFEKNASSMGHLGLKALRYQLDLKEKSGEASDKVKDYNKRIKELEEKRDRSSNEGERSKINADISKLKYDLRLWVGKQDYDDIDVKDRPLYLAPENIMAGYGYMDSLEEYKAVIRTSWDEFAKKLMSNEGMYKKIREDYEKETGEKVTSLKQAREIAKRHISGTFDNAHAGVWLKYFKRKDNESEEERIDRFNQWLNDEAEDMVKEGIVKHFHFNDTQGKDDDHNLLGSGILDIHDWRERLRKAGVKESLIVETGGRGATSMMHIMNAFDVFNPALRSVDGEVHRSYGLSRGAEQGMGANVSDWSTVKRAYENRPQYSEYGMSYSTFRHQAPQNGNSRGGWSGTGFF